ncbi:uncharacterized protein LOC142974551 [Anticarsia gemmatalis]|uniref:uncharacterized protein LOC142974551 n=1 Tax=Anticarsia gemmatalis TaxID=129554 RepID=UPI003F75A3C8
MFTISLVVVLVAASMASSDTNPFDAEKIYYDLKDAPQLFEQFIKDNERKYKDDADRQIHYEAFKKNLVEINKLNKEISGTVHGITGFADFTEEEYKNFFRPLPSPDGE